MAQAAIMGFGTVGSGVFAVLRENAAFIEKQLEMPITVKRVLDMRSFPGSDVAPYLTHDADDIINDSEIDIVVEAMGGLNPAFEYTMRALRAGKHVVTSNKELVSVRGAELMAAAEENHARYMFEASVGGGIPVIRPLKHMLLTERVSRVAGVLNGTTNYILSQMREHGAGFDETLREAQGRGFAERDPSADIDGFDACRKLAILLSACVGRQVNFSKIPTEGISKVTKDDFAFAAAAGDTIKLIARGDISADGIEAIVAPMILPGESPLGVVGGVYNAVSLTFSAIDNILLSGRGAGKYPTAGAIVSDMAEALRIAEAPPMWSEDEAVLLPAGEAVNAWMARLSYADEYAAKASAQDIFLTGDLIWLDAGIPGQAAFFTPPLKEREFAGKIRELGQTPGVAVENALRLYADR